MGYRSEVKSVIYQTKKKFDKFYKDNQEEIDYFQDTFRSLSIAIKGQYKVLFLNCYDVKWYDVFPEVQAWHKFLEKAEAKGMYYEFVRLGEDDSDVETHYSDYGTKDGSYILELEWHSKANVSVNFEREDYVRNTI